VGRGEIDREACNVHIDHIDHIDHRDMRFSFIQSSSCHYWYYLEVHSPCCIDPAI